MCRFHTDGRVPDYISKANSSCTWCGNSYNRGLIVRGDVMRRNGRPFRDARNGNTYSEVVVVYHGIEILVL